MTHDAVNLASRLADQHRYRQAFRVLLRAARRGDAAVFLNLGYLYDVGQGIRKSKRKALHWHRRALTAGVTTAAHNIGTVYRDRHDVVRAIRWFQRAVDMGHSGSNLELGQLILARLGQPAEALACFRAVGAEESDAEVEAAKTWAAVAEGVLA
jgi:TPR repeat protein